MKKALLLLSINLVFLVAIYAQPRRLNLNDESVLPVTLKSTQVIAKFDVATKNARPFAINRALLQTNNVSVGDTLLLALFPGKEYPSVIKSKTTDVNGTTVFLASLTGFRSAWCCISISNQAVLVTIDIPERKEKYTTRFQPKRSTQYLVQLDENKLDVLPDGHISTESMDSLAQSYLPKELQQNAPKEKTTSQNKVELKSAQINPNENDSAQIDILVVYTPAAKQWADTYEGGIDNTIGQAMAKCNLVSENSKLGIKFNLVHSTEVDYNETGNSLEDILNLSEGNIPNVSGNRNGIAADLVVLFSLMTDAGGRAWLLDNREGKEEFGYSIIRVQQAIGLATIHEIGHNLGAHHPKELISDQGPTVWSNWPENTWSAGCRWKGDDNNYYCTLMGYDAGWNYSDGNPTIQIPYFSDPDISFQGQPTGHATEANNARTIREMKHVVASYREAKSHNTSTVYTLNVHKITKEGAISGGCITNEGQLPVTSRGVVWSTKRMPTLNDNYTVDGSGVGAFNSQLSGLEANKVYYIRAYATNSAGTVYGNQVLTIHTGGEQRDFITRWQLPAGQNKLEFLLDRTDEVAYKWETVPAGQSGSGTFSLGYVLVTIPNLPVGQTIRLSLSPENIIHFYNLRVCPDPAIYGPDREYLLDVEQWGTAKWRSMQYAFYGCKNLNITATDIPQIDNVLKMNEMFGFCNKLTGPANINEWPVTNVIDMRGMFMKANLFKGTSKNHFFFFHSLLRSYANGMPQSLCFP